MDALRRVVAAGVASFALVAGAVVAAAPAHAVEQTPLAALQAAVAAPIAAFPDRAQVWVEQRSLSRTMRTEGRVGESAKRAYLTQTFEVAGQVLTSMMEGYNGTAKYSRAEASDLSAAQRAALVAAGKRGPYLLLEAPGPWDPGMAGIVKQYAPITIASFAIDGAAADDVGLEVLPDGSRLFRVDKVDTVIDLQVDRAGRFVRMWAQGSSETYESKLVAWGGAVDLGYPKGHSVVSAGDVSAAVAAYPRNVATAAVAAKASTVATALNKWAKKRHVAVTKAVIKKRAGKAITGYTVVTTSKGVKLTRTYAPAGHVSRCVIAKHGKAKPVAC